MFLLSYNIDQILAADGLVITNICYCYYCLGKIMNAIKLLYTGFLQVHKRAQEFCNGETNL